MQQKDFQTIINFLKSGQKTVEEDPFIQQAIGHFLNDLISASENSNIGEDAPYIFSQLYMLLSGKFYRFTDAQLETIITQVCTNAKDAGEAYYYASKFPSIEICKEIIKTYKDSLPTQIEHTQSDTIKINEVNTGVTNLTTSIFNSKQERCFFYALRNCYPNHFIYPNAALSTIVNSVFVKNILDSSEMKFFYNTTVDFVIIDQFNDFRPLVAIELDSEWHRLNNQNKKDDIKNKVFKAAGLPLYRIEHCNKFKAVEEFEKAIIEAVKVKLNG